MFISFINNALAPNSKNTREMPCNECGNRTFEFCYKCPSSMCHAHAFKAGFFYYCQRCVLKCPHCNQNNNHLSIKCTFHSCETFLCHNCHQIYLKRCPIHPPSEPTSFIFLYLGEEHPVTVNFEEHNVSSFFEMIIERFPLQMMPQDSTSIHEYLKECSHLAVFDQNPLKTLYLNAIYTYEKNADLSSLNLSGKILTWCFHDIPLYLTKEAKFLSPSSIPNIKSIVQSVLSIFSQDALSFVDTKDVLNLMCLPMCNFTVQFVKSRTNDSVLQSDFCHFDQKFNLGTLEDLCKVPNFSQFCARYVENCTFQNIKQMDHATRIHLSTTDAPQQTSSITFLFNSNKIVHIYFKDYEYEIYDYYG